MASTSGNLIREMPVHDRPRERFERLGAESLTDAELMAILLRTGSKGVSAVQLGEKLLKHFGGVEQLARRTVAEIAAVPGVGKTKAIMLKAGFELHARAQSRLLESQPMNTPEQIHKFMFEKVKFLDVEVLHGLALDSKLRLLRCYEITKGLVSQTLIHSREAFREAISASAAHLILVHNHPSGDPKPSADDVRTTREIIKAGEVLGIPVLDHLIIGWPSKENAKGYVSLKEMGIFQNG